MIASSALLSNTKESAATVGPQTRVKRSRSNIPVGACIKSPSLPAPLLNKIYKKRLQLDKLTLFYYFTTIFIY